ncbi:rCG58266 [Rattus norvegicus]|uniref:RCG58266 n=1 Tax=Rattus norvegicus TaxID=10116 RepID=A6J481_RAT|nr:rCG58266 [Rattus norvegicus]
MWVSLPNPVSSLCVPMLGPSLASKDTGRKLGTQRPGYLPPDELCLPVALLKSINICVKV